MTYAWSVKSHYVLLPTPNRISFKQHRLRPILTMASIEEKNPERVAAGLKATLHNPTVSAEAKSRARARLREMGVDPDTYKGKEDETQHHDLRHEEHVKGGYDTAEEHRILGGYKATLKNPNVSQEAKEHAKEVLKEHEAM